MRVSFFGKKIGMSQIRIGDEVLPVTLVQVLDHDVLSIKTLEKHGYNAVVFSAGDIKKEKNVAKPQLMQIKAKNLQPRTEIFEVRVESTSSIKDVTVDSEHFIQSLDGVYVDVSAKTIGKGFAGVMKRWNFRGLEASHGVSVSHRSHGSTGQRQDPGRVFPGKKMAGHYGHESVTIQNLKVVHVDQDLKVVAIHGAIPGHKNSFVYVNDSVKMGRQSSFAKVNNVNLVF